MKNYVLLYFNKGVREDVSPEDFKSEWGNWFGSLGDKIVDAGNPFNDGGKAISKAGTMDVKDMPSTGYSIVKANSMDEALALAQGCPVINEPEGAVCVYETLPM
ncbi:MAG: hypothetical protein WDN66_00325 [Candidatus Saccharibacteria bacterium]